jgi:hypothetical protein
MAWRSSCCPPSTQAIAHDRLCCGHIGTLAVVRLRSTHREALDLYIRTYRVHARGYSALTPAALTTNAHLALSVRI